MVKLINTFLYDSCFLGIFFLKSLKNIIFYVFFQTLQSFVSYISIWACSLSFFLLLRSGREGPGAQVVWSTCRNNYSLSDWTTEPISSLWKAPGMNLYIETLIRISYFCCGLLIYPWHLHQNIAHSRHMY